MDIEYRILNLYRTKQYDECNKLLSGSEDETRNNRMIDFIRMRVLTILAKVAGDSYEEVGYDQQHDELCSSAVAKTPRPGTSFQRSVPKSSMITSSFNQRAASTATARRQMRSGTVRSRSARTALHTAARASRAATATATGGSFAPSAAAGIPLTLTLLTKQDELFSAASKTMFEFVFYCEGEIRKALEIATQANRKENNADWWWDYSCAKCYNALGLHRPAEESLRQALRKNKHIAIYLRLVAMYVDLNQPLSALEICKQGLSVFLDDTALALEQARIQEEIGNSTLAVQSYRRVALEDATNMEAIASIAMYNFYNDQPEIALRYYRRLLASCHQGAEIYNNLGLCCLHCQQWDLTLPCFRQALYFSTNSSVRSEIWFNITHVALSTGDLNLARRCLQISLAMNSDLEVAKSALRALDTHMRSNK